MRKRIVSILGSNSNVSDQTILFAEELGKAIVDNGWILCTGGRSGIMEAASRGAQTSDAWTGHQVICILPSDSHDEANAFVDIAIPSGLGLLRNGLVVRAADACIAISGGAGTLSEIAFAWQFGTPIAAFTDGDGWAAQLAGQALDHRSPKTIHELANIADAINWLRDMFQ